MVKSVLEAIKHGEWNYEPERVGEESFLKTQAMPGSDEKLTVLADRVASGLPLWHGGDRTEYNDLD